MVVIFVDVIRALAPRLELLCSLALSSLKIDVNLWDVRQLNETSGAQSMEENTENLNLYKKKTSFNIFSLVGEAELAQQH